MKLYLSLSLLICAIQMHAQSIAKTMLRLPDTGQNTSYTGTFGEDNDFNINTPFFIVNGNGTLTDTVTGLMWAVTDIGDLTVEQARNYCDTLSLAGYTDWRMPSAHESFSILNHQHSNPALETTKFSNTVAEYWWSSTKQANDSTRIWVTNAGGGIGNHPKSESISAGGTKKFYVRAVRDINIPITFSNHFNKRSDGIIEDTLTNLIWQTQTSLNSDTMTWEAALTYAQTFQIGNYKSWRLPNIKELQSINEERFIAPSIDQTIFTNMGVNKFWSSTTLPNQTLQAWYLDTQFGITTYSLKTIKHRVILVTDEINPVSGIETKLNYKKGPIIFPNPSQHYLQLSELDESLSTSEGHIIIVNMNGDAVYKGPIENRIEFGMQKSGIYCLIIISENGRITQKFQIE